MTKTAFPQELLAKSTAKRLAYFKACTIAHPRLQAADQALRNAIEEPAGELLVFLYGPTGVGKTTVLGRCKQQVIDAQRKEMERDQGWMPIVGMEAMSPERGDFNWRDYYIDALRAFEPREDLSYVLDAIRLVARVPKDGLRVEAYGTVDELNAAIGLARRAGVRNSATAPYRLSDR